MADMTSGAIPHPAVLAAVTQGINTLFGAKQPMTMDAGGAVPTTDLIAAPSPVPAPKPVPMALSRGGAVPATAADIIGDAHAGGELVNQQIATRQAIEADRRANTTRKANAEYDATITPEVFGQNFDGSVHDFAQHLQDHALNDAGTPNNAQAIPVPAGAAPTPDPAAAAPPAGGAAPAPGGAPVAGPVGTPAGSPAGGVPIGAGPNAPAPASATAAASTPAPTPAEAATLGAVKSAIADPNASKGVPQQSPTESGKPHSLPNSFWDDSQKKLMAAVAAAHQEGKDPKQVFDSLTAVRNGFLQSNILKNLSAANVALQAGDMDAVEKSMKNMFYYFPDGKELHVTRTPDGQILYQDPIDPYKAGPNGTGKVPNMVPITAQHLQLLGEAALDPQKVAGSIASTRAAAAAQALEAAKAEAERMKGEGELRRGRGIELGGQAKFGEIASTNVRNLASAQLDQARAVTTGWAVRRLQQQMANQKLDPTVLRGAQAAAASMDDLFLGKKVAAPVNDPQGSPSLSPAAGKVVHEPSTVAPEFKNATPLDIAYAKGMASSIYAAGAKDGMQPAEAARIAADFHRMRNRTVNIGGKSQPWVWVHPGQGLAGMWNNKTKKYDTVRVDPAVAQDLSGGGPTAADLASIISGASGGTAAAPRGAIPNPVDLETTNSEQ